MSEHETPAKGDRPSGPKGKPHVERSEAQGLPMMAGSAPAEGGAARDTTPISTQIAEAESHALRAGLLLTLPFAVLHAHSLPIASACARTGFMAGADYLSALEAAMCSKRKPDGDWPDHHRAAIAGHHALLERFTSATDDATVAMMARADAKAGRTNPDLVGHPAYDAAWAETRGGGDS